MKKFLLLSSLIIAFYCAKAQSFQWAKTFSSNGSSFGSKGQSVVIDNLGNSYSTGSFSGTTDFDPGPGIYTITPAGSYNDAYITKLDLNGNLLWAKTVGGADQDMGVSIETDAANNVYIAGNFSQTVDFDPGPGTYTVAASGGADLFILKLDAAGNFIWVKTMESTISSSTKPNSIVLDGTGAIYTSGYGTNTSDVDPGPGTYTLSAGMFITKLDAAGNFLWAKGFGSGRCNSMCIDATGNLNATGYYGNVVDFDPGPGTYTLSAVGNSDIFVLRLDANSNFIWARSISGTDGDVAMGIATDAANNVYTTGYFSGSTDFDPGPGIFTMSSPTFRNDMFISKLDVNGDFVWAKRFIESNGLAIAIDSYSNVYTTGSTEGTDFDPGTGSFFLSPGNIYRGAFISKLDGAGNFILANILTNISTSAESTAYDIAVDAFGTIYTTGSFEGTVDLDPGVGPSTYTAGNNGNAFVNKLCAYPTLTVSGNTSVCAGESTILTVSGAANYTWSNGALTSTTSVAPTALTVYTVTGLSAGGCASSKTISVAVTSLPSLTISGTPSVCAGQSRTLTASGAITYTWSTGVNTTTTVVSPASATIYTVTGKSSAGCVNTKTVNITVSALPVISVNGNTLVCQGKNTVLTGSGVTSYTWNTGAHTSSINPTISTSTSFTLDGKGANGCAGLPAVVSVSVNPPPVITVSNGTVCSGQSFTLNPTGALSYTYSGGSAVVSPSSSSNYTISGLGSNGCTGTVVANVAVNALPNVSVTSNTMVLCSGNTATLSANGAVTYTWNTGETTASILVSPATTTSYTVTGTNANGCKKTTIATQSVSVCGVGVEQLLPNEIALQIYPNPAQNSLVISYVLEKASTVSISIADALGKVVKPVYTGTQGQAGAYAHTEAISDLNNGLYFVKIRIDHAEYTVKLVKMD